MDKRSPRWSADGKAIFYRTPNHEPFMIHLDSQEPERILPDTGLIGEVTPTPEASRIVYTRFRANVRDECDIWIADLDGGNRLMMTNLPALQYNPAVSPDGRRIAFISGREYGTHELYVRDVHEGSSRRLTNNTAMELWPAWSPDGKWIAYVSDETGNYDIWVTTPNGSNRRQLTEDSSIDTNPTWSPDGRQIAFTSNRSGRLQIWIMDADGGKPRQITKDSPSRDPSWRRTEP